MLQASGETVDEVVAAEMKSHGIPGLSLAIIDKGKIVRARGYGFTDKSGAAAVTTNTLFQAASMSKPVAALAALDQENEYTLFCAGQAPTEVSWPANFTTRTSSVEELPAEVAHDAAEGAPLARPVDPGGLLDRARDALEEAAHQPTRHGPGLPRRS